MHKIVRSRRTSPYRLLSAAAGILRLRELLENANMPSLTFPPDLQSRSKHSREFKINSENDSPSLTDWKRYCSPQFAPGQTVVDSVYCRDNSCVAYGGPDGFCERGIDRDRTAGRGPTDCAQVKKQLVPKGFICSMDYTVFVRFTSPSNS